MNREVRDQVFLVLIPVSVPITETETKTDPTHLQLRNSQESNEQIEIFTRKKHIFWEQKKIMSVTCKVGCTKDNTLL
jgi:hypothetical protein